jgi:hypothetical protein
MKSKTIDQIEKEAESDLILRMDKTEEDSASTPKIFNKYHKQLRLVSTELIQAQLSLKKLYRDKWMYYSGKAHPDIYKDKPLDLKIMKSDLKMFIESDSDVIKLSYQIEMLEMKKKYIKEKMKEINNRSFHIGNMIKTIYFKHGIN